jgi:hypothetical protein
MAGDRYGKNRCRKFQKWIAGAHESCNSSRIFRQKSSTPDVGISKIAVWRKTRRWQSQGKCRGKDAHKLPAKQLSIFS